MSPAVAFVNYKRRTKWKFRSWNSRAKWCNSHGVIHFSLRMLLRGFFRDLLELKSQLSVVKAEGMKDCLHIIRRRVWHQNVSHFVVSFRFLFFTVFLNLVQIHFPWSFNTVTDAFLFLFSNVLSIRLIDTTIVKFPTQCQYGVHSGVQTTSFWFTFR